MSRDIKMATVRCGVEDDVVRPPLDAAFQDRFERFVGGVFGVERQIVAEHDKAMRRTACERHQRGQAVDILAVDFDQLERSGLAVACEGGIDAGMCGLHQRRLAHAAGAPEQRVVGGQALCKALGILHQHVPDAVDAFEQRHLDAVDARNRSKPAIRVPHESISGAKVGQGRALRGQPFKRGGDALEQVALAGGTGARFSVSAWIGVSIGTLIWPSGSFRKSRCS